MVCGFVEALKTSRALINNSREQRLFVDGSERAQGPRRMAGHNWSEKANPATHANLRGSYLFSVRKRER
jgi:hypothetical protein